MSYGQDAKDLVCFFEQCRLKAYPDPESPLGKIYLLPEGQRPDLWWRLDGKPWTIGWGRTLNVVPGMVISQAQADADLDAKLEEDAEWVDKLVDAHEPLHDNEKDALTSMIYNIGAKAFAGSTLHQMLIDGETDFDTCAHEILRWDHSNGVVVKGLLRRRTAEAALFLGEDWRQAVTAFDANQTA